MSEAADKVSMPRRVVIDTNILVACAYAERSASRQVVEACLAGTLTAVASVLLCREYELILDRAVGNRRGQERLRRLIETAEMVSVDAVPRVVRKDADDDKLVATAVAGGADAIVTNDHHLLELGYHRGIEMLRPKELMERLY